MGTRSSGAVVRVVMGAMGALVVPLSYPHARSQTWVLLGYTVLACIQLLMIRRGIAEAQRPWIGGIVDVTLVAYFDHLLGLGAGYGGSLFAVAIALHTITTGRRAAPFFTSLTIGWLALFTALESAGVLDFAPLGPAWIAGRPEPLEAWLRVLTIAVGTSLMAAIVSQLLGRIAARESELLAANRALEAMSLRDPLTNLYNRRFVDGRIEEHVASTHPGLLSVIMVDLDRFKRINDALGHAQGDQLLVRIANALQARKRPEDFVARLGGDEFLMVVHDVEQNEAQAIAESLVTVVRAIGMEFDTERPVTASVGVATIRHDETVRSLIERADRSAYEAKRRGGDAFSIAGAISSIPASNGPRERRSTSRLD